MGLKQLLGFVKSSASARSRGFVTFPDNGQPSPYHDLPSDRFWKSGVADEDPLCINHLYQPRFTLAATDRIASAGSCFAQHISTQLRARGFNVIDKEPAPPGLRREHAQRFGYGTFSARYANIYVVRQLLQLAREALLHEKRSTNEIVWGKGDRYVDALRPSIEPDGFTSPEEVMLHRSFHIRKVRDLLLETNIFIFTLGLTECWENRETGLIYPTCPGTVAGRFDSKLHAFRNLTFNEIYDDFVAFRELLQKKNPGVKFILTVSPVPLTATATPQHVLTATTGSKATLRAVAGELAGAFPDVDYFPSFEIITGPQSRGQFYEANLRSIAPQGVEAVMRAFFSKQPPPQETPAKAKPGKRAKTAAAEELVCEEALLAAFQKK